jgi:membrane-bound ClpP family serine protease
MPTWPCSEEMPSRCYSQAKNKKEIIDMKTLRRLQNWSPRVLGILLLLTPFVFGIMTLGSSSLSAWILGSVIGVAAVALSIFWLGAFSNRVIEMITVMVGTVLVITPWIMNGSWFIADAWASCIVGLLLVLATGTLSLRNAGRQVGFATYRQLNSGSLESDTAY